MFAKQAPLLVLAALTLSACPAITPCPDGPAPPTLAACAVPVGGWDQSPQNSEGIDITISGAVNSVGTGAVPEGCFDTGGHVGAFTPDQTTALWATVTDDVSGEDWVVAFIAPDHAAGDLMPADSLSFQYAYRFGGFGPDVGHLTIRDAADALVAHVAAAGSVEQLAQIDEVSVAEGPARCSETDSCGSWSEYHLDILPADLSESQVLDYGLSWGNEASSDITVHHGGYARDTNQSTNCADWFVGDLDVAVISNRGLVWAN